MTLAKLAQWARGQQGKVDGDKHFVVKMPDGTYHQVRDVEVVDRRVVFLVQGLILRPDLIKAP
jgi:hypothetical protein